MTKQQFLESELRPGETLLWREEPDALAFLSGDKIFVLLFTTAWLAFAGAGAWETDFNFISLLMFAGGLLMFGGIIWETIQSLFTLYGITESRLLIVRVLPWRSETESYIDRDIRFLRKTRRKLTGASVVFTTIPYQGTKGRVNHRDVGFFGIEDPDFVEALIEKHFRYRDFNTHSTHADTNRNS